MKLRWKLFLRLMKAGFTHAQIEKRVYDCKGDAKNLGYAVALISAIISVALLG